ncbi:MAG: DUF177 domain-containing protein [Bacteroidales bacterium]
MKKVNNIEYIIPIKGLSIGKHYYNFTIGNSFFEEYEKSEIFGANLEIELTLDKQATFIDVKGGFKGTVITECDRCLGELELEIDFMASLLVRFGKIDPEEEIGGEEVLFLDPSESELDLRQFFYDYICLALPIQRVHKEEECDPEILEKLKSHALVSEQKIEIKESPFDKLKTLMN